MMKFALAFACTALVSARSTVNINLDLRSDDGIASTTYEQWAALFQKEPTAAGKVNFKANQQFILNHNAREAQGLETYRTGLNLLSDLSAEEYRARWLRPLNRTTFGKTVYLPEATAESVDWRKQGAVTPIKNQGQCGSCWSFSTTGSVEGAVKISGKSLISLSEQQLMDCSTAEGDHSCEGGLMDYGFKYIMDNKGINSEANYPYKAKDEACNKALEEHHVATITGFHDVPHGDEAQLIAAIEKGPVAVAIEADQAGFQHYASGDFSGPCGTKLDHGVLAVGFDTKSIIVKNSWGETWGDNGYINMARGMDICGIDMQASYPVA